VHSTQDDLVSVTSLDDEAWWDHARRSTGR